MLVGTFSVAKNYKNTSFMRPNINLFDFCLVVSIIFIIFGMLFRTLCMLTASSPAPKSLERVTVG